MSQSTLNSHQAHWLIQLAPHDFIIHYRKDKLNPADKSSCRSDYMNKNETKAPDIMVARLMPTLSNKLCLNRLESKELATTTLEVSEQISAADSISFTESLTRALSL